MPETSEPTIQLHQHHYGDRTAFQTGLGPFVACVSLLHNCLCRQRYSIVALFIWTIKQLLPKTICLSSLSTFHTYERNSQFNKMSNRSERQAEDYYEQRNDASPVPGDVVDNSYAQETRGELKNHIPVQSDQQGYDDPMQPPYSNTDNQLGMFPALMEPRWSLDGASGVD